MKLWCASIVLGTAVAAPGHRFACADYTQGKVFVAGVRQNPQGPVAGTNGVGSVLSVTFKALKPPPAGSAARIQLLSLSPEPPVTAPLKLPLEHSVRIAP